MLFFFNLFPSENMNFISCHLTPENVTWEIAGLHAWNALEEARINTLYIFPFFYKNSNFVKIVKI